MAVTDIEDHIDSLVERTKELMAEKGLSKRALAETFGMNFHAVDRFLIGDGRYSTVKTVLRIAEWVEENDR